MPRTKTEKPAPKAAETSATNGKMRDAEGFINLQFLDEDNRWQSIGGIALHVESLKPGDPKKDAQAVEAAKILEAGPAAIEGLIAQGRARIFLTDLTKPKETQSGGYGPTALAVAQ